MQLLKSIRFAALAVAITNTRANTWKPNFELEEYEHHQRSSPEYEPGTLNADSERGVSLGSVAGVHFYLENPKAPQAESNDGAVEMAGSKVFLDCDENYVNYKDSIENTDSIAYSDAREQEIIGEKQEMEPRSEHVRFEEETQEKPQWIHLDEVENAQRTEREEPESNERSENAQALPLGPIIVIHQTSLGPAMEIRQFEVPKMEESSQEMPEHISSFNNDKEEEEEKEVNEVNIEEKYPSDFQESEETDQPHYEEAEDLRSQYYESAEDRVYQTAEVAHNAFAECQAKCAPSSADQFICGNDGRLYDNLCVLQCRKLSLSSLEPATDVSICSKINASCDMECPKEESEVCGRDGFTYVNLCSYQRTYCNIDPALLAFKSGNCKQHIGLGK